MKYKNLRFWTDRGTCPLKVSDLLEDLDGKKIALFGTCGMGGDEKYYDTIKRSVEAWLPDECEELGFYMCQGKMPEHVLEKYESMRGKIPEEQLEKMLANYYNALSHPGEQDFEEARDFVKYICS